MTILRTIEELLLLRKRYIHLRAGDYRNNVMDDSSPWGVSEQGGVVRCGAVSITENVNLCRSVI